MIDEECPVRRRALSGDPVNDSSPAPCPQRTVHRGRFVQLEPLDADRHGDELWEVAGDAQAQPTWDYLPYGPWESRDAYVTWLRDRQAADDPLFFAIRDAESSCVAGVGSMMRVTPEARSIEVGHLWFSPRLQRTPAATEAIYLMIRHAFELGYRRIEWKCNALNAASRGAARRFGFTFEGIFYQHMISKGQNRDTAWYSILDGEWPAIRANFESWLAPENFDEQGRQRQSLGTMNATLN